MTIEDKRAPNALLEQLEQLATSKENIDFIARKNEYFYMSNDARYMCVFCMLIISTTIPVSIEILPITPLLLIFIICIELFLLYFALLSKEILLEVNMLIINKRILGFKQPFQQIQMAYRNIDEIAWVSAPKNGTWLSINGFTIQAKYKTLIFDKFELNDTTIFAKSLAKRCRLTIVDYRNPLIKRLKKYFKNKE